MRICGVLGCGKKHYGHGYCSKHYEHVKKHGRILLRTERTPNNISIWNSIGVMDLYDKNQNVIARATFDSKFYCVINGIRWRLMANGYVHSHKLGTYLHQLITGTSKKSQKVVVDHIDGDKLNNRLKNLRICTQSINAINSKMQNNNTSGHKGISYNKQYDKFETYIHKNNRRIHFGKFKTLEEAVAARKAAEWQYHTIFDDNGKPDLIYKKADKNKKQKPKEYQP